MQESYSINKHTCIIVSRNKMIFLQQCCNMVEQKHQNEANKFKILVPSFKQQICQPSTPMSTSTQSSEISCPMRRPKSTFRFHQGIPVAIFTMTNEDEDDCLTVTCVHPGKTAFHDFSCLFKFSKEFPSSKKFKSLNQSASNLWLIYDAILNLT